MSAARAHLKAIIDIYIFFLSHQFPSLLASILSDLCCLPFDVTQPFIPKGSESLVVLPLLVVAFTVAYGRDHQM